MRRDTIIAIILTAVIFMSASYNGQKPRATKMEVLGLKDMVPYIKKNIKDGWTVQHLTSTSSNGIIVILIK